jgi:hypothetical protein
LCHVFAYYRKGGQVVFRLALGGHKLRDALDQENGAVLHLTLLLIHGQSSGQKWSFSSFHSNETP